MKKILSSKITLILSILVFLFCSYWIITNIKFATIIDQVGEAQNVNKNSVEEDMSEEVLVGNRMGDGLGIFEVKDNKIFKLKSPDNLELIVDMNNVENIEYVGEVFASPDNKKICFTVQTIVPIWLYTFDLETNKLEKIDVAKNCFWSLDSRYIAYNNHTTDVSPIDVLVYDTQSKEIKNLTNNPYDGNYITQCHGIEWVSEDSVVFGCVNRKSSDVGITHEGEVFKYNVITGEEISVR